MAWVFSSARWIAAGALLPTAAGCPVPNSHYDGGQASDGADATSIATALATVGSSGTSTSASASASASAGESETLAGSGSDSASGSTAALTEASTSAMTVATTATSMGTTAAPTACGDGILEGDEECDDGNADNTDSCTNACAIAICGDGILGQDEACDDGNADNTDTCTNACMKRPVGVDFIPGPDTPLRGVNGLGGTKHATCPPGTALYKIHGEHSSPPARIVQLEPHCAKLSIAATDPPTLQLLPEPAELASYGDDASTKWDLECPPGTIITAMSGKTGNGGVTMLAVDCTALTITQNVDGFGLEWGAPMPLPLKGVNLGTSFGPDPCKAAIGAFAEEDLFSVIGFGLHCGTPILAYP